MHETRNSDSLSTQFKKTVIVLAGDAIVKGFNGSALAKKILLRACQMKRCAVVWVDEHRTSCIDQDANPSHRPKLGTEYYRCRICRRLTMQAEVPDEKACQCVCKLHGCSSRREVLCVTLFCPQNNLLVCNK